ncbi:MAG: RtcB family protein [Saprospiraceae bacterium]|nr:RtcB family protein [Saprospiraceae bacterium]
MNTNTYPENLTIFGEAIIDQNSIRQIENCFGADDLAVLTADAHYGYGHPIGGAVAYKNHISLSGVGFDIACGNKAVRTNILADEIDIRKVMDEIFTRISFGIGRPNNEPVDDPVFEKIEKAAFKPQQKMINLAVSQLGTVGAGNHFIDLFKDDEGFLWIGVHFGSRGFGHKTTTGFIALSQGARFNDRVSEGPMHAKPILFDLGSELAQAYIEAIHLAGEYAYAGRNAAVNKVLEILGNPEVTFEVHNHHNFAWEEEHFGEKYWVVRKGCTPAFPGQLGFIGATMMDTSVIVEGIDSDLSRKGLYSTVHGAGRVMSRTQAAGKRKWKKVKGGKRIQETVKEGLVNYRAVQIEMKNAKIQLRGGGADEAPECYKNLEEVLGHQGETIRVLHRLHPIGVAMAGSDTFDPYRD